MLSETFTREYKVQPGVTHPHMNMDAAAGFILSGTVVRPDERIGQHDRRRRRKIKTFEKSSSCMIKLKY